MRLSKKQRRWLQAGLVAVLLLPALWLVALAVGDGLGANPIEEITHLTGEWTLRLLLLTLCVTPARRLTGWSWLAPLRRTLGLLTFSYASLHLSTYLALDLFFDFAAIWEDLAERTYITAGFAGFVLMFPLALTSTRAAMRRLGKRWQSLHMLVYPAAMCGVAHFWWLVKADWLEPAIHGLILALLLGWRLWWRFRPRSLA